MSKVASTGGFSNREGLTGEGHARRTPLPVTNMKRTDLMPMRAPRICGCGLKIASGERCPCERKRKAEADARRPTARERGYDSKWDVERAAFLKVNPKCVRCPAPSTVVDHIVPHRGDQKLFWSRSNWQPLCRTCHDRWKQSQERRAAP